MLSLLLTFTTLVISCTKKSSERPKLSQTGMDDETGEKDGVQKALTRRKASSAKNRHESEEERKIRLLKQAKGVKGRR
uniref:Small EDRK-rich factor-like N-terminal domain-containing protein n=1 Tax=Setaria digitata TaxID=48799 RepID=A0A915PRB2_9BILA